MKILLTGGTGFVGSHVFRQLMAAGHEVHLLVRNPDKARQIYTGLENIDQLLQQGDITDKDSVINALNGCDAVVHCAAATPMQLKATDSLHDINVGGVKNVVDAALEQGIERIVCLSSITAIFNSGAHKVTANAPPSPSKMPYGKSKREAELYLRKLQSQGAPIAIIYPGGILGPDDPGLSDSCKAIKHRVENGFRIFGDGGMQYVDVRDLSAFICSLVEDWSSGRFLLPGVFSTWENQADIIEAVSGCELNRIHAQGWKLRLTGRLIDIARMFRKIDTPISAETMRYATLWPEISNTDELGKRGLTLRDPRESFDDTLRWMVKAGYLEASRCPASVQ